MVTRRAACSGPARPCQIGGCRSRGCWRTEGWLPAEKKRGRPASAVADGHELAVLLAVDARRSRPARSSTSLFDQLGDTSSTGTLQASSAQRAPRRAAALLEKMGCCSRGPWSAFPWSWRPPRSSTGKTKVVGLVELSMPAPLDTADTDGITSYYLALCDPPTGGTYVYVGPVGGSPPGADRRPRGTRRGGGRGWLTASAYTHSSSLHLLIVHGVGFSLPIAA